MSDCAGFISCNFRPVQCNYREKMRVKSYVLLQKKSFRKKSLGDLNQIDNGIYNANGPCNRIFQVEAPCAMSPPHLPLNAKPRHLFLFSDLLLVAKPRSTSSFKLKVRINSILIRRSGWPNFTSVSY